MKTLAFALLTAACLQAAAPTCNAGWPSRNILLTFVSPQGHIGNSYRAGFTAQLDGTASSAGDGTSITGYVWQQVPSISSGSDAQAGAIWSSHVISQPKVSGLVFGPWNLQLTVTQGNGQTATCYVYNGVVETDSNYTVLYPNTPLGNAAATIINHPVMYQQNPWLYYDNAMHDALVEIAQLYDLSNNGTPVNYSAVNSWGTPSSHGTIASITNITTGNGAFSLNGSGTQFKTDLCGGGSSLIGGQGLVIWYKTGRTVNGQPETGRLLVNTDSADACSSQTSMFAWIAGTAENQVAGGDSWPGDLAGWGGLAVLPVASQTNLQYSIINTNNCATNPGACYFFTQFPYYYDLGQAYYSMYFRSGVDIALWAARKITDAFWVSPGIDRGTALATGTFYGCVNAEGCQNLDFGGLVLRALDTGDGHADMWQGLEHIAFWAADYNSKYQDIPDLRIASDSQMALAYLAMFDPGVNSYSTSWCPNCVNIMNIGPMTFNQMARTALHWGINATDNQRGNAMWVSDRDSVQKGWISYYWITSSYDAGQAWSGAKATLTNGSTAVTCTGCSWSNAMFSQKTDLNSSVFPCTSGTYCTYPALLFCTSGGLVNSASCDTNDYCHGGCTFNSGTNTLTLDKPYTGTSGVHNWMTAAFNGSNGAAAGSIYTYIAVTGAGQNSFMVGIATAGFNMAAQACAGAPAGCAAGDAATFAGYSLDASNWVLNYSQTADLYGLSYFGGYPTCTQGQSTPVAVPDSNKQCLVSTDYPTGASEIAGDSVVGMIRVYQTNPTVGLKTWLDQWYSTMWAKSGVGTPPVASPTGTWDLNFDTDRGQCSLNSGYPDFNCDGGVYGYYLNSAGNLGGQPWQAQKFIAQHFGISNEASWPAVRLGGPVASNLVTIKVPAYIAGVTNATKYSVTITDPSGVIEAPIVCSSSPCSVTVDATAGNYLYQVAYLSSSNAVLARGLAVPLLVN